MTQTMSPSDRFAGLKKIPKEPALRLLALANMRLDSPLQAPASAPVDHVLRELDAAGAWLDMLRLLAAALPPRERVWWGCLAAQDTLPDGAAVPQTLSAAQAWVFKPGDDTRARARAALDLAEFDDRAALCATAVAMCDGKLGTGDLAAHDAPPGAASLAILGAALLSLGSVDSAAFDARKTRLIDSALDIARGGNGRLDMSERGSQQGDAP